MLLVLLDVLNRFLSYKYVGSPVTTFLWITRIIQKVMKAEVKNFAGMSTFNFINMAW